MPKAFGTCVLVGTLTIFPLHEGMALTTEDIIKSLQSRENNIKTIKGTFKLTTVEINSGKTIEETYRWVKKDKMESLSRTYISLPQGVKAIRPCKEIDNCFIGPPTDMAMSFDGEVTKIYIPEYRQGFINRGDFISVGFGEIPADWFLLRFGKRRFSAYLKQEDVEVMYIGKKKLAGEVCHLLELSRWGETISMSFYLSDKKGLAPIRFEYKWKNLSFPFDGKAVQTLNKFHSYGDVWFPSEIVSTRYHVYSDTQQTSMKKTVIVENLEVNIEIPQKDIILKFPSGTLVSDNILHLRYRVP